MKILNVSLALAALTLLSTPAFGGDEVLGNVPPTDYENVKWAANKVKINSIRYFGEGCPKDSNPTVTDGSTTEGKWRFGNISIDFNGNFGVNLPRSWRRRSLTCKIEIAGRVEDGWTVGSLKQHLETYVEVPGRRATITIHSKARTHGLSYRNAIRHRQNVFGHHQAIKATPKFSIQFDNLGDPNDHRCNIDRIFLITIDTKIDIRHRGGVWGQSAARVDKTSFSFPPIDGIQGVPCAPGAGNAIDDQRLFIPEDEQTDWPFFRKP